MAFFCKNEFVGFPFCCLHAEQNGENRLKKFAIFTELRLFFLHINSESTLALKANHQLQTDTTPPKHKHFPSNKHWEKAWSIRSPTVHTISAAAAWCQNYTSLMLRYFSCPESVIDLWLRFTRVAPERHKHRFLIWRLIYQSHGYTLSTKDIYIPRIHIEHQKYIYHHGYTLSTKIIYVRAVDTH